MEKALSVAAVSLCVSPASHVSSFAVLHLAGPVTCDAPMSKYTHPIDILRNGQQAQRGESR